MTVLMKYRGKEEPYMTSTDYPHCFLRNNQLKTVIGLEKKNAVGVLERYLLPDRMVVLIEKILGSFLQNKLFIRYIEYGVQTQYVRIWYSKLRLGLCRLQRTILSVIHRESNIGNTGLADSMADYFPLQWSKSFIVKE